MILPAIQPALQQRHTIDDRGCVYRATLSQGVRLSPDPDSRLPNARVTGVRWVRPEIGNHKIAFRAVAALPPFYV